LVLLRETYPALFTKPVPLALGIDRQIKAARQAGALPLTTISLKLALTAWVKSDGYIAALIAGGFRVGLDGQPTEPVSPEHIASAVKLRARREKRKNESLASRVADPV
jgi:sRNA-binding protein